MLNYCQCQLELGEYYEVLEHTTELLQKHNGTRALSPPLKGGLLGAQWAHGPWDLPCRSPCSHKPCVCDGAPCPLGSMSHFSHIPSSTMSAPPHIP